MKRLLFATLLLTGLAVQAGDNRQSLRGLNGIYVAVQLVNEHVAGFATNDVEALVKSELAAGSVQIDSAPKESDGNANLCVTLAVVRQPQLNAYLFTVEVAVTQDVRLSRLPHAADLPAETWRKTIQGLTTPARTDLISAALTQAVGLFVKDYHAVNAGTR